MTLHSRFVVRSRTGEVLGIFPKDALGSGQIKALLEANPGSQVKSMVTSDNPCAEHPAFEADNCPSCGTSASF